MIKKIGSCVLLASAVLLCNADSAYAQRATGLGGPTAPQTINLTLGMYFPVGDDNCQDIGCGRVDGDVLVANRSLLVFDFSEFKSFAIGGEYLFPIGNYIEAGAGMSFSQKTVASVYDLFVDSDGTEIDQDLKLRQVPLAFTVRALPLGQGNPIQPYVGGGFRHFPLALFRNRGVRGLLCEQRDLRGDLRGQRHESGRDFHRRSYGSRGTH